MVTSNVDLRDAPAATLVPERAEHSARPIRSVTVVLPCLNEEEGVAPTVHEAYEGLRLAGVTGEVLVVDNGSTDRSVEYARQAGARVIFEPRRGYGAAHLAGIDAANCDVVVMADADGTYALRDMRLLLEPLRAGADMAMGSRLLGGIERNAMPVLHRHVGTPVITRLLRWVIGVSVSDSQSGYRAFWRDDALRLGMRAPGMEYASEMLLRAGRAGWRIADVPAPYRPRLGESKLNTFDDGWRHLRMLLVLSPHLSLLLPGILVAVVGLLLSLASIVSPSGIPVGPLRWFPVFVGPMLLILGTQAIFLGSIASGRSEMTPERIRRRLSFMGRPGALNRLLRNFALVAVAGIAVNALLFGLWVSDLSGRTALGVAGLAQAAIVIGAMGIAAVLAADFSRDELWS